MGRNRSFRRHIARARRRGHALHRMVGSTVGMSLALVAPNAWAQTPPPSSAEQKEGKDDVALPGVDVRSQRNQFKIEEPSLYKLPDPIKDTPQSITVIPEQVLDERAMFTLRDALRTVPGISLAAGEGGRAPGRQPHPARLPGRQRHLHRRGARPGPVLPRHLQPRVGRGAQGPLVGPVRPRLHRRHHQPGQQDAEAHPVLRDQRHRRQRPAGAGHPRLQPALRRRGRPAPEPDGLQGRHPGPRPGHERALGRGAVVRHRPQRPHPADRQLLLPGRRQPARLRPAVSARRPGQGQHRELLRVPQARLRARRRPHRHGPARARLQREHPLPQHPALRPGRPRLARLHPRHRGDARAACPSPRSRSPAPASSGRRWTRAC